MKLEPRSLVPSPPNGSLPPVAQYIHYGTALQELSSLLEGTGPWLSRDGLSDSVLEAIQVGRDAAAVLAFFGNPRLRKGLADLPRAFAESLRLQALFHKLRCRGFSYALMEDFDFPEPLQPAIDLRFMLASAPNLFYPPRVRRYLQRVRAVHCRDSGYPSLAFALGIRRRSDWFFFVLQSEMFFRPSYVRDHFRGATRILFSIVLDRARQEQANVYLVTSNGALRACHPRILTPQRLPNTWSIFYEKTATFFGMKPVSLAQAVDAQVHLEGDPCPEVDFLLLRPSGDSKCMENTSL